MYFVYDFIINNNNNNKTKNSAKCIKELRNPVTGALGALCADRQNANEQREKIAVAGDSVMATYIRVESGGGRRRRVNTGPGRPLPVSHHGLRSRRA